MGKLVYQKSENENVLALPEIAFYNSTYLKHLINFKSTGGKVLAMVGFDLFYNTKYYRRCLYAIVEFISSAKHESNWATTLILTFF